MANKEPLVSVIMNCFNSDKYLKEAIDSVIAQTYQNWEIIFWDNQSTDRSAEIVNSYDDKRIKYFYTVKHTRLGEARNLAIEKCDGDWIAFLDCDDFWDNDKLSLSFNAYNKSNNHTNISLIYTLTNIINDHNKIIYKNSKFFSGNIHDNLLKFENFITFSSIMVKKSVLLKVGCINPYLNYCEDYDLLLKISENSLAICVSSYLTFYRVHQSSITSVHGNINNIEVIEYLEEYIKHNKSNFKVKFFVYLNNSYRVGSLIVKLLLQKKFQESSQAVLRFHKYLYLFPFAFIKRIIND